MDRSMTIASGRSRIAFSIPSKPSAAVSTAMPDMRMYSAYSSRVSL